MRARGLRTLALRLKAFNARLSLRTRLLLGLVFVTALGFVVADTVVYHQNRLVPRHPGRSRARRDELRVASPLGDLRNGVSVPPGRGRSSPHRAVALSKTNTLTRPVPNRSCRPALAVKAANAANGVYLSTGATGNASFSYRILASSTSRFVPSGAVVVVALPLTGLNGTLHPALARRHRVSLGVFALLMGLGYVLVRVGMRPSVRSSATAGSIAAGDLKPSASQADRQPRTEVGAASERH